MEKSIVKGKPMILEEGVRGRVKPLTSKEYYDIQKKPIMVDEMTCDELANDSKYRDITIDKYDDYEPVLDDEDQPMQFNSFSEAKQYVIDNVDENATEDAYRYIWASVDSDDNLVEMQSGQHVCNVMHHEVTVKPWCTTEDNNFMVIASEPR